MFSQRECLASLFANKSKQYIIYDAYHKNFYRIIAQIQKIPYFCFQSIKISIPLADGNPDSRVYAYDVDIVSGNPKEMVTKSVYFEGVNCGIGHEPNKGVTTMEIPKSELPKGRRLTVSVTPLSSLGTKGKAIAAEWKI